MYQKDKITTEPVSSVMQCLSSAKITNKKAKIPCYMNNTQFMRYIALKTGFGVILSF